MAHFVDVEALNFRSAPEVNPGNRKAVLHIGQAVEVLGGGAQEWHQVRVDLADGPADGFIAKVIAAQPVTGFLARPSLREPVSEAREELVATAIAQWLRFSKGQGKENVDPFFKFVGEMWKGIGIKLDGKDVDVPWSAAAISFMARKASARFPVYGKFKFAAAHSKYMHDSIMKRKSGSTDVPFWGFRLDEALPEIGDIVGRWREVPRTFQDAVVSDSFKSHTDIIISVSPDYVLAIGGNIRNSVSISRYPKTASGHLSDAEGAIILMVNQLG